MSSIKRRWGFENFTQPEEPEVPEVSDVEYEETLTDVDDALERMGVGQVDVSSLSVTAAVIADGEIDGNVSEKALAMSKVSVESIAARWRIRGGTVGLEDFKESPKVALEGISKVISQIWTGLVNIIERIITLFGTAINYLTNVGKRTVKDVAKLKARYDALPEGKKKLAPGTILMGGWSSVYVVNNRIEVKNVHDYIEEMLKDDAKYYNNIRVFVSTLGELTRRPADDSVLNGSTSSMEQRVRSKISDRLKAIDYGRIDDGINPFGVNVSKELVKHKLSDLADVHISALPGNIFYITGTRLEKDTNYKVDVSRIATAPYKESPIKIPSGDDDIAILCNGLTVAGGEYDKILKKGSEVIKAYREMRDNIIKLRHDDIKFPERADLSDADRVSFEKAYRKAVVNEAVACLANAKVVGSLRAKVTPRVLTGITGYIGAYLSELEK